LAGVNFDFLGRFIFPDSFFGGREFTGAGAVADQIIFIRKPPAILWVRTRKLPLDFPIHSDDRDFVSHIIAAKKRMRGLE
jgi:hypothetical protein